MSYDPFGRNAGRPYPSAEFLQGQQEGGQAADAQFGDATVGADPSQNDYGFDSQSAGADTGSSYDPFGGSRAASTAGRQGSLAAGSEDLQLPMTPTPEPEKPLPRFEPGEDWKTSIFNTAKNVGTGVQDALKWATGGGDPSALGGIPNKVGQAISFFPSTVTSLFGLPAVANSEKARQAYTANRKTLEGGEPGPFDFPAVARGLNAARETRAGELGSIAENEQADPMERLKGAVGQGLYGALPNVAPVGILPRGTAGAVTGLAGDVAEHAAPAARLLASRVKGEFTPAERPVAGGMTRLYRGEGKDGATSFSGGDDMANNLQNAGIEDPVRFFSRDRKIADDFAGLYDESYGQYLRDEKGVTGPQSRVTSLDLPSDRVSEFETRYGPKWDAENKRLGNRGGETETLVPEDLYKNRGDIPMERPIVTHLKGFLKDEGGDLGDNIQAWMRGKTPEQIRAIQETSGQLADQVGAKSPAAPAEPVANHLNPQVVGTAAAARNQLVHDTHLSLIDAVKRMQAGDPNAEAEVAQHLQTLRDNNVKATSTLVKLKQAGITGLPGTGVEVTGGGTAGTKIPTPRQPRQSAASLKADLQPGAAANAELARSRGVDPAAALKGTTEPMSTAAALRQKLSGASTAGTPLNERFQPSGTKSYAQRVAEAKARLAEPVQPPLAPIAAQQGPKGLSLLNDLTNKDMSAEDILRQRSLSRIEGQPPAAEPAPLPQIAKPPAAQKPVQTGQLRTKVNPPAAGAIIPKAAPLAADASFAEKKAAAIAAEQRAARAPGPKTTIAAPTTLPTSPTPSVPGAAVSTRSGTAAPVAAPAANIQAAPPVPVAKPQSGVPKPSQPLLNSSGGTPSTGAPKVKAPPAPGTVTFKQNMQTLQWEAKRSGVTIGTGATKAQATKAAQQWLAQNGGGAGGVTPPPTAAGAGGKGGGPIGSPLPGYTPKKIGLISEVMNAPRALETPGDVSMSLRQGLVRSMGHPVAFAKAMKVQLQYLGNVVKHHGDEFAVQAMDKIQNQPDFMAMAKLKPDFLTSWDAKLGPMEESYLSSRLAGAPVIRQSNRAGVLFLNTLRYESTRNVWRQMEKNGASDATKKGVLDYVGAATGRGNFPKFLEQHAGTLAGIFYSPKFTWSRFETAFAPGKALVTRNPYLAKESVRDLVSTFVAGKTLQALAQLNGAKVEQDETSPDWGKIQVGNTRVDMWGGYQPIARLINQAWEGRRTYIGGGGTEIDRSTGMPSGMKWDAAGNKTPVTDVSKFSQLLQKYRPEGVGKEFLTKSIYGKFLRSKLSPVTGAAVDAMTGEDYAGKQYTSGGDFAERQLARAITPLGWQDLYEAVADEKRKGGSGLAGAAAGGLSLLGAGVQTIPEDNTQYPMLSEIAVGGARNALAGTSSNLNTGGVTPTVKPTATPKRTATPAKGPAYNPFGR